MTPRISLPDDELGGRLADLRRSGEVDAVVWDFSGPPPDGAPIDLAVPPYRPDVDLGVLDAARVRAVQSQLLGYDTVIGAVPDGIVWCNAVGVHEGPTAELAVGLMVLAQRGLDTAARAMPAGHWDPRPGPGLLGHRVLLLGHGGIGTEIARRLDGFGVELIRVARTARTENGVPVHGLDELSRLLPQADIVSVAVPYGPSTHHLVDETFCAAMRPGALLVNVARGRVADTDALFRHAAAGRLRLALDVVDPEPLPADHPLWTTPGVFVAPHVGGAVTTIGDRMEPLLRRQIRRLRAGEPLDHIVDLTG